jgi:ATP-dependent RNA helicase DDX55/SPB4
MLFAPDFMSVRKIPLKEQQYIEADGNTITTEVERPLDPVVSTYLTQIRKSVLTDRALHEKVEFWVLSVIRPIPHSSL